MRAGGDRSVRSVLDLAEPIAMQGFDRARPLWEITVVEGLEDDRAALILKVHHAITDGVGAVQIALVMFELERATGELDDMPAAPEAAVLGQVGRFWDAIDHERRRNLGIAMRSAGTVVGGLRSALGDPAGTAERAGATAASVARMVAPATAPLSPLMTGRSLSVHFDTLSVGLARGEGRRQAVGGTLNDAFVAATAGGFRRYHEAHGGRSRRAAHDDADQRAHRGDLATWPATSSSPPASRSPSTSTTRSSASRPSTSSWPCSGPSRRWRWSSRWPGC